MSGVRCLYCGGLDTCTNTKCSCPFCGGAGWRREYAEAPKTCTHCKGAGELKRKPIACRVHPAKSGAERKTIGLYPRPGQTEDEAYAEWALHRRGEVCTCPVAEGV